MNKEEMFKLINRIVETDKDFDMQSMDDMLCLFGWIAAKNIAQEFNYDIIQTEKLETIMINTLEQFVSCISKLSKKED